MLSSKNLQGLKMLKFQPLLFPSFPQPQKGQNIFLFGQRTPMSPSLAFAVPSTLTFKTPGVFVFCVHVCVFSKEKGEGSILLIFCCCLSFLPSSPSIFLMISALNILYNFQDLFRQSSFSCCAPLFPSLSTY